MRVPQPLLVSIISILCLFCAPLCSAGDALSSDRAKMKDIAKQVSKEIEKNYYDPKMNGLDWAALTEQAKEKIDKANSIGEMMTAIFVMVDKLKDSHTYFLPPDRNVSYKYGFDAKPFGDDVRVYELRSKGAAERDGLKVGDKILTVNGYPAQRASFDQMMLFMRVLRPVMVMDMKVQADGEEPRMVKVTANIKKDAVVMDLEHRPNDVWDLINEDINDNNIESHKFRTGMMEGEVGYIKVRNFETESSFLDGLMSEVKGAKALILDMRDNPGGAVDTLRSFSGWFEEKPADMFQVQYRSKSEPMSVKPKRSRFSGPIYILIDSHSGSCAEFFARYFQMTKRATIIGDRSSGRAQVARIFSEEYGTDRIVPYLIEITIGNVTAADGKTVEHVGVTPDITCVPSGKDLHDDHDTCRGLAHREALKALNPDKVAAAGEAK